MTLWIIAQFAFVAFIVWQFLRDRFAVLSAFADAIEWHFPWFSWDRHGDWISWVHHALWTALVGALGGLITLATLGVFRPGFQRFALVMLAFYSVREGVGLWQQRGTPGAWSRPGRTPARVGWLVDGVMDVVGPALVVALSFL